ncbi:MAG TPA: 5'-methylthioadenosine/adenosylhomocysteine nucleosidase [Candidatus Bacteroides merdigallinarum]|uniref:adenosylhomocysteine nucleosidase n=1 Tax=Candidatus Bacteroides merdigallinarum TaxID=2838473 RepID=A0A9D2E937_9BACE|nr:5'-methylthioadenosine/adenosylhomocysteine nucleosidase [Candidatus Bacteroides merdigallinarum]
MKIGVINAMEDEHARLASHLTEAHEQSCGLYNYVEGCLGANNLVLTRCGIGKVNAALGAAELIRRFAPDCIVSTGVAGGTGMDLQVTDVVAGARVAYHDVWCGDGNALGQVQGLPAVFEADARLLDCARRLAETGGLENRIHCGLICTGDQFITDRDKLADIRAAFPDVQAVDMESAAIAQTCYLYRVPFISFRIVSDTPGSEGHWQQYLDFWGTVADRSFHATKAFLEMLA